MPDDMEQIEARLAAYIDGALPPEQRAEIEAYLKANAGHARLITELKSIKTAVSTLPKEKAPAEVLDTLQSHLERHSLLEGVEESSSSTRINRWPQLGAVAAVLLLAGGLGVLVYQVLPAPKNGQSELAMLSNTTRPDVAADGLLSEEPLDGEATRGAFAKSSRDDHELARRPRVRSENAIPPSPSDGQQYQSQLGLATPQEQQLGQLPESQQTAPATPAPQNNSTAVESAIEFGGMAMPAAPMTSPTTAPAPLGPVVRVLRVESDDPTLTQALLAGSLAQSGLAFELAMAHADGAADAALPTTMPTTTPAVTVASLADRLKPVAGGDQVRPIDTTAARPVVVRNLSETQAYYFANGLDAQPPSRRGVTLMFDAPAPTSPAMTRPATGPSPTTLPAEGFEGLAAMKDQAALPAAPVPSVGEPEPARPFAPPASQPAGPVGDLVVFIVQRPPAATTGPAAAPAATAPMLDVPSTPPVVDEVP